MKLPGSRSRKWSSITVRSGKGFWPRRRRAEALNRESSSWALQWAGK
jgi:hypothetical protein